MLRAVATIAFGLSLLAAVALPRIALAGEPPLQLPWPVGTTHYIAYNGYSYGCSTPGHQGADYYAIDFAMGEQNPVASTANGTVTTVSNNSGYGNYVIVTHSQGFTSLYAHLHHSSVSVGQVLKQGQLIGGAGHTGNAIGDHLHFVVRQNGSAYRPEPTSGYDNFGDWGACGSGQSPTYRSKAPASNDYNGDGCPDLMARETSTNKLWMYPGPCSTGYPGSRVEYKSNWSALNSSFGGGSYTSDGCMDVIARRASDSALLNYPGVTTPTCASGLGSQVQIGTGWGALTQLFSPRDFTGDGCPDVIARDASGNLLLYNGPESAGSCTGGDLSNWGSIGNGWQYYDQLLGPGDFSGDGCFDVVGRRISDGILFMWEGNCNGAWKTGNGIQIGTGWQYHNLILGPGDYDKDGCVDIVARLAASGNLYLYRGNCASGFAAEGIQIGNGWQVMNMIF